MTGGRGRRLAGAVAVVLALSSGVACSAERGGGAAAEEHPPATSPGRAGSDGADAGGATPATLPDPGVAPGTCAVVTYTPPTAADAQEADLCRPPAPGARDVGVVLVHGGGGIAGDRSGLRAWADAYRAGGYTTLSIDYHLFDPGGESPVFPRPEQDVKAAVQYLRGVAPSLGLDPDRIVVHGQSAGARLGAVAFTTAGDARFDDGRALWPGIDQRVNGLIGFYSTYDGTMQYDGQYYGGSRDDPDPEVRANWVAADAIVNAGRPDAVGGPAVFFTGEADWVDLQLHQEALAERVRAAGYHATSTLVPGGDHGFDVGPSGLTEAGRTTALAVAAWLDQQFPQ